MDAGRTTVDVSWEPPQLINRPVTQYTIYYTTNGLQPVKNWKQISIDGTDLIREWAASPQLFSRAQTVRDHHRFVA